MKTVKIIIGSYILLNSMNLYAESAKECMKYWQEPTAPIKVLGEVECENIWDFGKTNATKNRLQLLDQLGLKSKNSQWMSTGNCSKVLYDKKTYYIYQAYYKQDKDDIWIAYNDKSAFAYFRKVISPLSNGENAGVSLKCAKTGGYAEAKTVLNSYLKSKTSVSMSTYKSDDWYKED